MGKALIVLTVVGACLPPAFADIIDFEDLYPGRVPAKRYISQGLTLTTDGTDVVAVSSSNAHTGEIWVYGNIGSLAAGDVIATFSIPGTETPGITDAVSFHVVGTGGDSIPWSTYIYGLDGGLLDSDTSLNTYIQFNRPTKDVHRLVFSPSLDLQGIDTLSFNTITPEPTTIILLSLGAVVMLRHRAGTSVADPDKRKTK